MVDTIHVFIATDNHLVPHLAALLKSISINYKSNYILSINIINDGISKKNLLRIKREILSEKIILNFVKTKDALPEGIHLPIDNSNYPVTNYLRLLIPYILPVGINKVIYIDVDTIVLDDISKLYKFEIGENIIGAVTDVSETIRVGIPNYKELGISPELKYFNSGVLLINVEKWKKNDITNKVINVIENNRKYATYADQYGLNVVLHNSWIELPEIWNCFAERKMDKPSVIHFTSIKPIYTSYYKEEEYKDIFYEYLQLTSWKKFKPINEYYRLGKKLRNRVSKIYAKFFNK